MEGISPVGAKRPARCPSSAWSRASTVTVPVGAAGTESGRSCWSPIDTQPRSSTNTVPSARRSGVRTSKPGSPFGSTRLRTSSSSCGRYVPRTSTVRHCRVERYAVRDRSSSSSGTGAAAALEVISAFAAAVSARRENCHQDSRPQPIAKAMASASERRHRPSETSARRIRLSCSTGRSAYSVRRWIERLHLEGEGPRGQEVAEHLHVLVAREPDLEPVARVDARVAPLDRGRRLDAAARPGAGVAPGAGRGRHSGRERCSSASCGTTPGLITLLPPLAPTFASTTAT